MEIKVNSADELTKLFDYLEEEIRTAYTCHQLCCDLIDSINDNWKESIQAKTFWYYTLNSLHDAMMIRLCRVFDQSSKACSLLSLLKKIKANTCFFGERLKDNSFVESLAKDDSRPDAKDVYFRIPDEKQLEEDIQFCSHKGNPLVKKLVLWRSNSVAHKSEKILFGKDKILIDNPLGKQEIKALLDESFNIHNRYLSLYEARTWLRDVVDCNDYKNIFKYIKLGLQKWNENYR